MPFRTKAKALFKSKNRSTSPSNASTSASSSDGPNHDVYKPGEPMPPPKYRRPPAKEHTEKLESFSFADAWRKKSFQSSHSPMGTRAQSRRTSFLSAGRRSTPASRRGSATGPGGVLATPGEEHKDALALAAQLTPEPEAEGDDDVANVGLSRVQSKKDRHTRTEESLQPNGLPKALSTAHDHQPFSEHDLASALKRSQMQVAAH